MVILLCTGLACGGKAEEVRQRAAQQLEGAAEKLAGNESSQQEKDVKPTTDPAYNAAPTLKPNANKPGKTPLAKSGLAPIVPTKMLKRKSTPSSQGVIGPPPSTPTPTPMGQIGPPPSTPTPISTENGNDLSFGEVPGKKMVRTAMSLQHHTIWVSEDAPSSQIKSHLAKKGFRIEGNIIRGDNVIRGTQAYVAVNRDSIVVAFRGTVGSTRTETLSNIFTDANATLKKIKFIDDSVAGHSRYQALKVHSGFHNEYNHVREKVIRYVNQNPNKKIFVTGFSMGGALATLASFDIALHTGREVTMYNSGAPRVGGSEFRAEFKKVVPASYRVAVHKDPGPQVPGVWVDYEHIGRLLQIYKNGHIMKPDDIKPATGPLFHGGVFKEWLNKKIDGYDDLNMLAFIKTLLTVFDADRHKKPLYLESIENLYSLCNANSQKCPTISSMDEAAFAERQAAK
jgi:hypothetical protein